MLFKLGCSRPLQVDIENINFCPNNSTSMFQSIDIQASHHSYYTNAYKSVVDIQATISYLLHKKVQQNTTKKKKRRKGRIDKTLPSGKRLVRFESVFPIQHPLARGFIHCLKHWQENGMVEHLLAYIPKQIVYKRIPYRHPLERFSHHLLKTLVVLFRQILHFVPVLSSLVNI